MTRMLCAIALLLGSPCHAQPVGTQAPEDEIGSWLKHLDGQIYTPPKLSGLEFGFRPQYAPGEGKEEARKAPYTVRYQWRAGVGDRLDLLGHQRVVISCLPGFTDEQHQKCVQDFLVVARNLAGLVKGMSLSKQYAGWRGRVVKKVVNNQEEVSLVMEPRAVKRLRRVTIHLRRNGIPWRTEKVYASGDRFTQHATYEERAEGLVLTKLQRIHTPADPRQRAFDSAFILTWQRVGGILLPGSVQKLGKHLPATVRGTTAFLDMKINDDVATFEALKVTDKGGG